MGSEGIQYTVVTHNRRKQQKQASSSLTQAKINLLTLWGRLAPCLSRQSNYKDKDTEGIHADDDDDDDDDGDGDGDGEDDDDVVVDDDDVDDDDDDANIVHVLDESLNLIGRGGKAGRTHIRHPFFPHDCVLCVIHAGCATAGNI
eukprot:6467579-Amphidinium_carterae.1